MHDYESCKEHAAVQWRLPTNLAAKHDWLIVAYIYITWISNLVPLLEGLCSLNPVDLISRCLIFCWNRTHDLGIDSPALWPTKLVLHRLGYRLKIKSQHCAAAFFMQVRKSCIDLDPTLLQENEMLALGICMPQSRHRAVQGCRLAASRSRLYYYSQFFRFHNNEFDEMLCKLESSEYARSFQTKPNPALIFRELPHTLLIEPIGLQKEVFPKIRSSEISVASYTILFYPWKRT